MKITSVGSVWEAYQAQQTGRINKVNRNDNKKDIFTLSDSAKDFQTALKAAQSAPDIRHDKIAPIKSAINSETYAVSDSDIAEHILNSSQMFRRV